MSKKSNCASHHYGCKRSKVPSVFVFCAAAACRRTRNDVSTTRKASLSLAASGFSLLPWQQLPLPARVGLPVFIHFCLHAQEESQRALFTLPYMGFFLINKGHRASPDAEKISMNTSTNTYGSVQHVRACTTQHTLTHTRVPVPWLFKAFQTSPICTQLSPLTVRWNVNGYAIRGGFQGSVQQMIK